MLLELFKIDITGPARPMFFTGKPIQNYKFTRFCIGFPVKNTGLVGPVKSILKSSKSIHQPYIMPLHGKKGYRSYFRSFRQIQHTLLCMGHLKISTSVLKFYFAKISLAFKTFWIFC